MTKMKIGMIDLLMNDKETLSAFFVPYTSSLKTVLTKKKKNKKL